MSRSGVFSVITAFAIGSEDFTGSNSQAMLNSDGSESASVTNVSAFTSSAVDSGTITWTCSG